MVIAEKEAEIRLLKEHTSVENHELITERAKIEKLHEQLRQRSEVLAKQCERVRELERSRAELERERRQVDTRIMLEIAKREVSITR